MPEQAIMPTAGAAPTTGAGAQPARAGFTMEDIPAFFKNRNLMGKPYDERSSMLETVINGAYQDAAQNGLSPKEHVAFGDFVQKARQKLADSETAGEKVMGATRFVGESLAGMGKDIGAVAYAGGNATSDIHHGRPDRALATAATMGNAATNKLVGYGADLEQWGKAHTAEGKALDSGINDVLSGIDKGEHLKDPVGWLKSQADKLTPLQEKYHAGGIDDPSQLTLANGLDTPENTALLTTYMATRNPVAKAQLKANLLRTGQRAAVAKDQQEILNSPGAKEFEKTFPGGAQHLVNGSDPVTLLSLAFPFLRAVGATEVAASALSKAASFAAQQTAFGVVSAITADPSHPEYLKHIGGAFALGGASHTAGALFKAALNRGMEPPPLPPEAQSGTEPPPVPETPPATSGTTDTDAVAMEQFGNTGKGFTKTELPPGHGTEGGYVKLPTGALDHGIELIRQGITDFAKWSVAMVKKFGEAIRDYLKDVWAAATKTSETGALNIHALNKAKAEVKQYRSVKRMKKFLSALADVAQNKAGTTARQVGNHIRQKFGQEVHKGKEATPEQKRDMEAAPFALEAFTQAELARVAAGQPSGATVAEAKAALASQIADVQRNATPELQRKWVPLMQHALTNFDDVTAKSATSKRLLTAEQNQEQSYGIKQEHVENYVSHIYANIDEMRGKNAPQPLFGGGGSGGGASRYFVKGRKFNTLADAIQAGYDPQSTNIADLAEHRIKHGQVLVEQANARERMMTSTDPHSGERIVRPHLDRDYYEINSGRGTAVQGHIYRTGNQFAVEQGGTRIVYPTLADAKTAVAATGAKLAYKKFKETQGHPNYRKVNMGGQDMQVYSPYEGLMDALYARRSKARNSLVGRTALLTSQFVKHAQVFFDIVHVGNVAWTQLFGGGGFGYSKGLSLLEHSPSDMQRMRASGEIDQRTLDYYQQNRAKLEAGLKEGLNVGKISDAIYADTVKGLGDWLTQHGMSALGKPVSALGQFAPWVFQKLTRGAMVQTFLKFQDRYLGFGMSMEEASRAAALEVNRAYGSLSMQGILKDRTWQDVARVVAFAPQWAEGRATMELQGMRQIGEIPLNLLRGKFQVGNVARMQIGAALTLIAAAQAINYATTGHSTFGNEDGHQLDAWVPGGAHGMWISPMNILAHNTEMLHRYYSDSQARSGGDKLLALEDAVMQLAEAKMSAPARAAKIWATSKDYSGTRLQTATGKYTEMALTMLPAPIPITSIMRHGPGEFPQLTLMGSQPGALEKQAFASLGIHAVNARGPQDKMYSLARPFRKDGSYNPEPSKYTQIRRDLKGGFEDDARDRMVDLLSTGSAALANMDEAMGMEGGTYHRPLFTGTQAAENAMRSSLGSSDKKLYEDAVNEHREQAHQYWAIRNSILPKLRDAAKDGKDALARKRQEAKDKVAGSGE